MWLTYRSVFDLAPSILVVENCAHTTPALVLHLPHTSKGTPFGPCLHLERRYWTKTERFSEEYHGTLLRKSLYNRQQVNMLLS